MNYLSLFNKDLNSVNSVNFNNKFIYLNRECNLKHWNSFFDNKNKIQLMILGRPAIEVSDWAKFDNFEENYITKFLIKKYIDLEINDFCNQLNGAFSVLVIDYKLNKHLKIKRFTHYNIFAPCNLYIHLCFFLAYAYANIV